LKDFIDISLECMHHMLNSASQAEVQALR